MAGTNAVSQGDVTAPSLHMTDADRGREGGIYERKTEEKNPFGLRETSCLHLGMPSLFSSGL